MQRTQLNTFVALLKWHLSLTGQLFQFDILLYYVVVTAARAYHDRHNDIQRFHTQDAGRIVPKNCAKYIHATNVSV